MRRVVIVSLSLCFLGSVGCAKKTDPNLCADVIAHKTKLLNGEGEVDEHVELLLEEEGGGLRNSRAAMEDEHAPRKLRCLQTKMRVADEEARDHSRV